MGNYDFTGLSTSSFESLAQALAVKVLGGGTIIFGVGPDGGREATYEGRVSYPSAAEQWEGYIVLQAKFRQRLTDRATDADWAIQLLREELDKYVEAKGGRRVPDYYIFVTNVVLTPVQKKGGKDRVAKVFDEYRKKLPIKGWRVWDYDQLTTFLDAEESVRRAFTAFITSGDVLAEVIQWLKPARTDFEEVMTGYLSRELNNAKHADLEQSGNFRILLSRVFVDLPLSKERLAEPPNEAEKPLAGVVTTILDAARERVDQVSRVQRSIAAAPVSARFVIVGGPGQGKTTIGQFACQLFRAAILKDRRARLSEEVVAALDEIVTISEHEEIELPRARRFPLHVVLRDFATVLSRRKLAIASGQPLPELTLFGYLVDRIGGRTDQKVTADDFRAWLRAYPWLLVLDGLDEVPSSSNRAEVLQAIEEFWMEATHANADLLMIASTRPQDYQDDFSPAYYAHRWLVPLSPERALRYGKRLLEVRHGTDTDRSAELLARMEQAAAAEATARLMRTPLQVTIMATLVEQIGRPPQDRWRLFREYYGAIYRRERERTPSELLGKYESDINAIHYRTGFELQIMSESPGQTEARLSKEQFQAIVRARLAEQGHAGTALDHLVREIVDAAANRLVFIVGLDVDQVGFEIRSLQEFMAAEALLGLSADTATMQKRLRAIAPVPSWRNVFIFAAGRCFADLESLIDTIHAICRELNGETSALAKATQEGSVLALELLEDAAVAAKPKHARLLAETALELLSAPPGEVHARLAAAHSEAVDTLYREEITRHLKLAAVGEQLGAWKALIHLLNRGVVWAEELATAFWPQGDDALEVVGAASDASGTWLLDRAGRLITRIPRREATYRDNGIFLENASPQLRNVLLESGIYSYTLTAIRNGRNKIPSFKLQIQPLRAFEELAGEDFPSPADAHPSWRPILLLAQYCPRVDAKSLATFLDAARDIALTPEELDAESRTLPWPAGVMLHGATAEVLTGRASDLRRGEYGDRADWLAAEKRWGNGAVDLYEMNDMKLPMPRDIATRGYPYQVASAGVSSSAPDKAAKAFSQWFRSATSPSFRATLASWLLFAAAFSRKRLHITDEMLAEALTLTETSAFTGVITSFKGSPIAAELVDLLGRREHVHGSIFEPDDVRKIAMSLLRENSRRAGIARVLAVSLNLSTVRHYRDDLPVLEADRNDPTRCRSAVATLNAISGKYDDAQRLAMTIVREFPEAAARIANLLVAPYRACDEELLLVLDAELPPAAWRSRIRVRRTLENLQRSKPGPERGRAFWEELGFARVNLAG